MDKIIDVLVDKCLDSTHKLFSPYLKTELLKLNEAKEGPRSLFFHSSRAYFDEKTKGNEYLRLLKSVVFRENVNLFKVRHIRIPKLLTELDVPSKYKWPDPSKPVKSVKNDPYLMQEVLVQNLESEQRVNVFKMRDGMKVEVDDELVVEVPHSEYFGVDWPLVFIRIAFTRRNEYVQIMEGDYINLNLAVSRKLEEYIGKLEMRRGKEGWKEVFESNDYNVYWRTSDGLHQNFFLTACFCLEQQWEQNYEAHYWGFKVR